ncbi:Hypothetical_protein [Hexamita inflata]|uniref:Hypothetical_protein n=1 Tax=Hexamita inflata TaxID=28002 RepID=A0AA86Q2H7_9EUKA|nr:Hypothetical protein HINF_LOCUS32812 [Hexamita inflata]
MSVLMRRENTLIIEPGSDISKIQIINFILLPNSKKHFEGPPLQCVCDTNGGYSIISGSCQCDESKGRKWKNNQCGCNGLLGFYLYPGQNVCTCQKELGFNENGGLQKCMCDVNRGFFALPVLNAASGQYSCSCDSTRKYVNDTSAATPTCVKKNKSGALVGGIIGAILAIILISVVVIALLYKKKRSKSDNKVKTLENSSHSSSKKSRLSSNSPKISNIKQVPIKPIQKLSSIQNQPKTLPKMGKSNTLAPGAKKPLLLNSNLLKEAALDQSNQFKNELYSPELSRTNSHNSEEVPKKRMKVKKLMNSNTLAPMGAQPGLKMMQQQATVNKLRVNGLQPVKKSIKPKMTVQDII